MKSKRGKWLQTSCISILIDSPLDCCGPQTCESWGLGQRIWAPNLFIGGIPNNPTRKLPQTQVGWSFFNYLSLSFNFFFFWKTPFSPLIVILPSSPSLSLSLSLLFLSILSTPFHRLPSFPLYSLSLVGFKSLLFHQFPSNPTVTQNPKKQSCFLRILLKLVLDVKQFSAANSPKALKTLGNRLESNHFIITFPPPYRSIVDRTLWASPER